MKNANSTSSTCPVRNPSLSTTASAQAPALRGMINPYSKKVIQRKRDDYQNVSTSTVSKTPGLSFEKTTVAVPPPLSKSQMTNRYSSAPTTVQAASFYTDVKPKVDAKHAVSLAPPILYKQNQDFQPNKRTKLVHNPYDKKNTQRKNSTSLLSASSSKTMPTPTKATASSTSISNPYVKNNDKRPNTENYCSTSSTPAQPRFSGDINRGHQPYVSQQKFSMSNHHTPNKNSFSSSVTNNSKENKSNSNRTDSSSLCFDDDGIDWGAICLELDKKENDIISNKNNGGNKSMQANTCISSSSSSTMINKPSLNNSNSITVTKPTAVTTTKTTYQRSSQTKPMVNPYLKSSNLKKNSTVTISTSSIKQKSPINSSCDTKHVLRQNGHEKTASNNISVLMKNDKSQGKNFINKNDTFSMSSSPSLVKKNVIQNHRSQIMTETDNSNNNYNKRGTTFTKSVSLPTKSTSKQKNMPARLDRPSQWNQQQKQEEKCTVHNPPLKRSMSVPISPHSTQKQNNSTPNLDKKPSHSSPSSVLLNKNDVNISASSSNRQQQPQQQVSSSSSSSSHLPKLPSNMSYDPSRLLPIRDQHSKSLIKNARISDKLNNGWTLMVHQKEGVLKALRLRRMVLAYDMGLGKTLIACVWAKAFKLTFPCLKIYVIAPVSLLNDWKKTAENAVGLDIRDTATQKKKKKKKKAKGERDGIHDVVDDINSLVEEKSPLESNLDMEICTWGKIPQPEDLPPGVLNYVVICDEAHNMQSIDTKRTLNVLKLTKSKKCVGVLLLTGTPMKNGKPINLFPLLKAINHPLGENQKAYEALFCSGKEKHFGSGRVVWDANGSSNLPVLQAHISSHVLHKTKEDCLQNLPGKTRERRIVTLSKRGEMAYANAIQEFGKTQAMVKSRSDTDFTREENNEVMLSALHKIRYASAKAKVEATVSLAAKVLEKEPAVVIFTSFVNIAKEVYTKMNEIGWTGELLTGETPTKKRPESVENFQNGVSSVFTCTFGVGGVGLTLTAAHTIILIDRPWTPGEVLQAEDRVRRIGQTKEVKSIWLVAFDIDKEIDSMIEEKKVNTSKVIGNNNSSNRSNEAEQDEKNKGCTWVGAKDAPKISLFKLMKSIVVPQPPSTPNEK